MNNQCPKCNSPMQFRPAGISKNGKPYSAFWSCSNRVCGNTINVETPPTLPPANPAPMPTSFGQPVKPPPSTMTTGVMDVTFFQDEEKNRQLRIARESALSTIAKTMEPQKDSMVAAREMIRGAEVLMKYIYTGQPSEEMSEAELDKVAEIFKAQ